MDPISTSTAIVALVTTAKTYADKILVKPLAELGGILSDTVGQWRLRNQARLLNKTREILEKKGIEPSKVLPDVFVPLVDAAGDTSDETLSDMFANLLAGHLSNGDVHPAYSKILGQMSALDGKV